MTSTVRQAVLGFVRKYPAVHLREIDRRLHLPDGLAAYHLTILESEGLVRSVRERGFLRYVTQDQTWDTATLRRLSILRREPALKTLLLLLREGPLAHGEVRKELGLSKATTSYHLGRLVQIGLVMSKDGSYRVRDADETRRLVRLVPPLPGVLEEFVAVWDDLVG